MALEIIAKKPDGFYHPASEEELAALVAYAYQNGLQVRARGSAHSVACAIYTDPCTPGENHVEQQSPPAGPNLNIMLDQYIGLAVYDREKRRVIADAGIHLGKDPSDPTGTSSLENSLLYRLNTEFQWTLSDTGGIIHQTVSGFTATGSSGGSLTYSVNANLYGFRVIDGTGAVTEVTRDDTDPDKQALFHSLAPSMGVMGIVSKVILECVPSFNITGQEAVSTIDGAAIDLFGAGTPARPSLEAFLRDAEYARLTWWPQRGAERVQVWQAQQIRPQIGFIPRRYEEFTNQPEQAEAFIYVFYTFLGNLQDLNRVKPQLEQGWDALTEILRTILESGGVPVLVAKGIEGLLNLAFEAAFPLLNAVAPQFQSYIPQIFRAVIDKFIPLDTTKQGMEKGTPQVFDDWSWQGLPMDNQAADNQIPTEFTEIWVPLGRTSQVMNLLKDYFAAPAGEDESYARTGTYGWELYTAMPTPFWMSASHTDGADEWKDGAFRVDIYWWAENPGDPALTFYPQYWKLFRDAGIPFRLHWAKFQPVIPEGDPEGWTAFFRAQYPKWDAFMELRRRRDPNNVFLTDYWRERFGLRAEPRPQPQPVAVPSTSSAAGTATHG
ncbi:MAG TPA: D-arabinono-1,4-lactone oxidase [Longimicrobium sp.]|nr:D-arabinono-1,4-lactone oxidase [Longimicrobium sp.]